MNLKLIVFIVLGVVLLGVPFASGTHKQKGGGKVVVVSPVQNQKHHKPPPPPPPPPQKPVGGHPNKEININISINKGGKGGVNKGKGKH